MTTALTLSGVMRPIAWLACTATTLAVLSSLAGCGTPGRGTGTTASADIATASDETEVRRRARIRMELAIGYFEQGQDEVALDEVKLALASDPMYADAFNLRGLIYTRMNEAQLADESFRRALELNPRSGDVMHNYAWFQCQQNRLPQAIELFNRALSSPNYGSAARTWLAKGTCQVRAGALADAEVSFSRSYELDAGNPVTALSLSRLLLSRNQLDRARFYVRRVVGSEFVSPEALWLAARIERRAGNLDAAMQLGTEMRRRFPQAREVLAFERGRWDE